MMETKKDKHVQALSAFMSTVYVWMSGALLLTTCAAYGTYCSAPLFNFIMHKGIFTPLLLAEVALVFALSFFINKMSFGLATIMYVAYSIMTGVTLSVIFLVYQLPSIALILLVTMVMFMGMAMYGYYTKTDLTSVGNILLMGLFGIVIAGFANLFFHNTVVDFLCTALGVIIFTGLIAYDTQRIKNLGGEYTSQGLSDNKIALICALALYLDFVNLFLKLLRIFGKKKN